MRKKILTAMAALALASGPAAAQGVPEVAPGMHTGDSLTMLVDSLQREVRMLRESGAELEADARDRRVWKDRAKYFNVAYVSQSLSLKDAPGTWRADYGVALTRGRTYYLHKKPLLGMIKFGIDWTQIDINFAKYEDKWGFFSGYGYGDYDGGGNYYDPYDDYDTGGPEDMYQAELAMAVGPSVTVNPVDELKAALYFRVAPSLAMLYVADELSMSYGTFFTFGGSVSWKVISLGIEGRWGNVKYDSLFDVDDYDGSGGGETPEEEASPKWKVGSMRFYISLRF